MRTAFNILIKFCLSLVLIIPFGAQGQQKSVARLWNEILLEAIRNDFARPTVHARNLFHISAAMYDAWSVYDHIAVPYFLGRNHAGFTIALENFSKPLEIQAAREEAISHACYHLLAHRFSRSPGWPHVSTLMDHLMDSLDYDKDDQIVDYQGGSPAAMGNYIAESIIAHGLQDGANERQNYINRRYEPVNDPLNLELPGSQDIEGH